MSRYGQLPPPHMRGHLCSLPIDNPPPTTLLPTDPTERQKRLSRQKHKYRNEISPLNPDQFRPDFDVVEELRTNKEPYSAWDDNDKAYATIYSWPSICRMSVDNIRSKVSKSPIAGIHPTLACCISHGLDVLRENQYIIKLIWYREKFYSSDVKTSGHVMLAVFEWFNGFVMEVESSGKKQNVVLPQDIYSSLNDLASGIGLSKGSLACLASMITLSDQDQINKDHAKLMKQTTNKFLEKVEVRVRGTEYLMNGFGL